MDCFCRFLLVLWLVSIPGLALPASSEEKFELSPHIEELLKKEMESENIPPRILSKTLTYLHKYNDSQLNEEGQVATSKFSSTGGLENKIQNLGGVQKTILNNQIQYNFHFWLLPKDFNRIAWEKH